MNIFPPRARGCGASSLHDQLDAWAFDETIPIPSPDSRRLGIAGTRVAPGVMLAARHGIGSDAHMCVLCTPGVWQAC